MLVMLTTVQIYVSMVHGKHGTRNRYPGPPSTFKSLELEAGRKGKL